MESARKDLCNDQNYDPLTAFKSMDHFKHNRVISYQLFSFFQLHRIQSTIEECDQIIACLDKSLTYIDYESFQEMTLPADTYLKNLAKTRYSNVPIGVGSYNHLTFVKYHSAHLIALFLQKQLNFGRLFFLRRQQFCRKWGGDMYTLLQKMFKTNQKQSKGCLQFESFYNCSKQYGIIFNQNEFRNIWRRSKKNRQSLQQSSGNIMLCFDNMHTLLLVNNFDINKRLIQTTNIPVLKVLQKPTPSYHISHWKEYEKWKQSQRLQQMNNIDKIHKYKEVKLNYKYSFPESVKDMYGVKRELQDKNKEWLTRVDRMNDKQLISEFLKNTGKSFLFSR